MSSKKPELKAKLQSKAHSAVSDLITVEKTMVRGSKSKEVGLNDLIQSR